MRHQQKINHDWQFHLGPIDEPRKTVRKAAAIGGLTAPLDDEAGPVVLTGAGGEHFLRLIAQGDSQKGLRQLAGTQLNGQLSSEWQSVNLPHDWLNELDYVNDPELLMSGSKPQGISYYRKTFRLSEKEVANQQVFLHFMGVMRMASVWLNGMFLGDHYSGYSDFSFDITEMARYDAEGENVLLVKVDTTTGSEGWWYEGAGIYKEVYLEFLPLVRIDSCETFIETKALNEKEALLEINTRVTNQSNQPQKLTLTAQIGEEINNLSCFLEPFATEHFSYYQRVPHPKAWSIDVPNLEVARFQLMKDQEVVDEYCQSYGIRMIDYTSQGFYLNGQLLSLRGVCEHQNFGGMGVALNRDILRYKLLKMKEMGVNAYRSAHHFASKELLELCDELGIIMMNENRVLEASEWRIAELEKMVKQTRNHPCLCFWSLCNEEVIGNTAMATRMAKRLANVIRCQTSQSLLVSAELLNPEGAVEKDYLDIFDVKGVNYPESGVNGAGLTKLKEQYPGLAYLSTESASYFSTRGIYQDNEEKCQTNNFGSRFSMVLPGKRQLGELGVGGTAHPEEVLAFYDNHRFMGGVFLWTFMDYYGEPAPFPWPGISSQFGICDTVGFEKDYFYYYQSKWSETPMVHVMPHWNEAGLEKNEQGQVEVRVFSNCREVELFVNNRSCGRQHSGKDYTSWWVTFESGELKVVGYHEAGEVVDSRVSSEAITGLTVHERYVGDSYCLYEIAGIDQRGKFVPMADSLVEVSCIEGQVLALANGNPADLTGFNKRKKRLFSGRLMAIVAKNGDHVPKLSVALKDN